jgi:hypothetical protein
MTAKPRLLLLDAGAVIAAFRCRGWDALCAGYEIVVPSIIVAEAHFFPDREGRRQPIDLALLAASDTIREYEAPLDEFTRTAAMLHPELRSRVHAGEQEALTYLRTHPTDGVAFLSADGGAIEAAVALGVGDCAMSLETALQKVGQTKPLPEQHTEAFVRRKVQEGSIRMVQGRARAP